MGLTTDPRDPDLREIDPVTGMQKTYLILPDGQRKELVAPVRRSYRHVKCGTVTTMSQAIAETYAANPTFYGGTYCAGCGIHFYFRAPDGDFRWLDDDTRVGDMPVAQSSENNS